MTFCVLVVFKTRLPKLIETGVITSVARAFSPVPEREMEAGTEDTLVVILTVAETLAAAVGAKVTVYARLPDGGIDCGIEGPAMENCLSETEREEIVAEAVPVFEMVSVCLAVCPTTTFWKLNEVAEKEREREGGCVEFTLAQPIAKAEISSRPAAQARLREEKEIERSPSTWRKVPRVAMNDQSSFRCMVSQPVPGTVMGQGGNCPALYKRTGESSMESKR